MIVVRFLVNVIIIAAELAMVAGAAWVGLYHPVIFAGMTAILAATLGIVLEHARLRHELPFYFGRGYIPGVIFTRGLSLLDAVVKGLLAGVMALLTFSGTDTARLFWVAVIFAGALFAGTSILRRLSISLGARPSRWGYFRLAAPLGLLFSLALTFLPTLSFFEIGRTILFDLPANPSIPQVSEVLFVLKQKFDALIVLVLSNFMNSDAARIAGSVVSVNVLSGFVIALYAVIIAEIVSWAERRNV